MLYSNTQCYVLSNYAVLFFRNTIIDMTEKKDYNGSMQTTLERIDEFQVDRTALKRLREARGYSLRDVAVTMGVSRQNIWNYEKGLCEPSAPILARLCKVYGCEISDVLKKISEKDNISY